MKQKIVKIFFKNKEDFRNRIARLWQDQKEDETYEFHYPDKETEDEMNNLAKCFTEGQQGARYGLDKNKR